MLVMKAPRAIGAQDRISGRLYGRPDLVPVYAVTHLVPAEAITLIVHREDINARRVLDLGCGAGRLAAYLRPLTALYTGVDISPHMVEYCRRTFQDLQFIQGDMRSLPQLQDGSFDAVFAVFNLLDAVSHEDRLRTLAEIHRLLAPKGLFMFSAHNRGYLLAKEGPRMRWSRNPITQLRLLADYVKAVANRRRIGRLQRNEADYSLLNDAGHNYAVLHYYIDREAQTRQLTDAGFVLLECLNERGETLASGSDDSSSASIHYVARRGA